MPIRRSRMDNDLKLLLIGGNKTHEVGFFLAQAANQLGIQCPLLPTSTAFEGNRILRSACWRIAKWPLAMRRYQQVVLDAVRNSKPDIVLTTGISPLTAHTLQKIRDMGCKTANFSTDDPWNQSQRAQWFLKSLPEYNIIFTPRIHTAEDFRSVGCTDVIRTMFAYSPQVHINREAYPVQKPNCDVAMIGGADSDRIPFARALIRAGYRVGLWGGYWNRNPGLRRYSHGVIPIEQVISIASSVPVNVCMVRRANRDSHCMRSFEIPVAPGFMVIERTDDHKELFDSQFYESITFSNPEELVNVVSWVLKNGLKRESIREMYSKRIRSEPNTYRDRLNQMMRHL